tara:strand:+ start:53 stop:385 length:333 start_codon:yes stop_codon:yes gene_type:complete
MADINKMTAQESLNVDSCGIWTEGNATFAASADANTVHIDVSSYHSLTVEAPSGVFLNFTASETDIDVDGGVTIDYGSSINSFKIPHGIGNTIYLNMVSTAADTIKYVLH